MKRMAGYSRLSAFLLVGLVACTGARAESSTFVSAGRRISVDVDCKAPAATGSVVIFLHGSGGPRSPGIPYSDELQKLVGPGYCVFLPHYLDATRGSATDPARHYPRNHPANYR